jgi:hypothetical protein
MLHDQKEIEQAELVLSRLATPGRLQILSLVNNRLFKMRIQAEIENNQMAIEVIDNLIKFLKPITNLEMTQFGDDVLLSYSALCEIQDLTSVEEVEMNMQLSPVEEETP